MGGAMLPGDRPGGRKRPRRGRPVRRRAPATRRNSSVFERRRPRRRFIALGRAAAVVRNPVRVVEGWSVVRQRRGLRRRRYLGSRLRAFGRAPAKCSVSRTIIAIPRAAGVMERCFSQVSRKDIFAATGVQFMPINTLYQLIAMREASPQLMAQAERFLMMPDFFHWLLCGSQVVEFSNATTSQCLNATSRDWARDVLAKFGIPTSMFPKSCDRERRWASCGPTWPTAAALPGCRSWRRRLMTQGRRSRPSRPRRPARPSGPTSVREPGR